MQERLALVNNNLSSPQPGRAGLKAQVLPLPARQPTHAGR